MIEKDIAQQVIEKLNDLYVRNRSKYLILNSDGQYSTIYYNKKQKDKNKKGAKPLIDFHMKRHLQGKATVGVFASYLDTKLICFDVDIKDKEQAKSVVYKLIYTLTWLGIEHEYIHISTSGNKGYHVEIFFDEPISNDTVKSFYLLVMNKSQLINLDFGQVELRPTATQGVKIPLGCNFKNKDWQTQECWYIDFENRLEPIKSEEYILTIRKLESSKLLDILNKHEDAINRYSEKQIEEYQNVVEQYKPLEVYKQNIDEGSTLEAIEKLIEEGLTRPNTRHNSLLKIAKYYRHIGMSREEAEPLLIDWMKSQDKRLYTSSWEFCHKDIREIVKDVYERGYSLTHTKSIGITEDETRQIIEVEGKSDKLVIYAMLTHSKRYALSNGVFYMTVVQIEEATGLTDKTIRNAVKRLEEKNLIEVVSRNQGTIDRKTGQKTKKPNKYKVTLAVSCALGEGQENRKFTVCGKGCENCLQACLCSFYKDEEIKKVVSRRQFEDIREFREYCSNEVNRTA
jgi:hypothetical protein